MYVSAEAVSAITAQTARNVKITVPGRPNLDVLSAMTVKAGMEKVLITGGLNASGIRSRKHMLTGPERNSGCYKGRKARDKDRMEKWELPQYRLNIPKNLPYVHLPGDPNREQWRQMEREAQKEQKIITCSRH